MRIVRSFPSFGVIRCLNLLLAMAASAMCLASAPPRSPMDLAPAAAAGMTAPIALTDLTARTEEEQQLVDRVQRLLAAADPVAQLRNSLDDIDRTVDAKLRITAGIRLRALPVMRLESLARHWEFDARRFAQ
jgi:hypothetical protein